MAAISTLVGASIAATAVGTGLQVAGAMGAADAQKDIIAGERKAEAARLEAMKWQARRADLEELRKLQRTQAAGIAIANAQGAGEGSGILGGLAQAVGQAYTNRAGIFGALQTGQQLFDINKDISSAKESLASYQSLGSLGQGLGSFGGSIMNAASAFSRLEQGFKNPYTFNGYNSPNRPGSLY